MAPQDLQLHPQHIREADDQHALAACQAASMSPSQQQLRPRLQMGDEASKQQHADGQRRHPVQHHPCALTHQSSPHQLHPSASGSTSDGDDDAPWRRGSGSDSSDSGTDPSVGRAAAADALSTRPAGADALTPFRGSSEAAAGTGHIHVHGEFVDRTGCAELGAPPRSHRLEPEYSQGPEDGEEEEEGEEEEHSGELYAYNGVFCTNCTAELYGGDVCGDCGHSRSCDDDLFNSSFAASSSAHGAAVAAAPGLALSDRPVLVWDEAMLLHEQEGGVGPHPERPDRLRAVMARLQSSGLAAACRRLPARPASDAELLAVHGREHLAQLRALQVSVQQSPSAREALSAGDNYMNAHTLRCAELAAGSAAEVAATVAAGAAPAGAAIVRPPGHHAESNTAMGFCFFNNAAVAARAAQAAGARRVLVLDWDVHHGNGTQHIFYGDPSVLFMSIHRHDRGAFYPGSGAPEEVGAGAGAGFNVNIAWDMGGVGDGDYLYALQQLVVPIARAYAPDIILVSAGFDAVDGDPIGGCHVSPACFGHMTAALLPIGPTVLLLEGGYNLAATAAATEACLAVLLGAQPVPLMSPCHPSAFGWLATQAAKRAQAPYWPRVVAGELAAAALPAAALPKPRASWHAGDFEALQQRAHRGAGRASVDGGARSASAQSLPGRHAQRGARAVAGATRRGSHPGGSGGGAQQLRQADRLSRKLELMKAIRRKAMRAFWRRRQRLAAERRAAASGGGGGAAAAVGDGAQQ